MNNKSLLLLFISSLLLTGCSKSPIDAKKRDRQFNVLKYLRRRNLLIRMFLVMN